MDTDIHKTPAKNDEKNTEKGERIAKFMARAGLCSRREAERWITKGLVKVNGTTLETPACVVTSADAIHVKGKLITAAQETRLFLYHKTTGLITSTHDPEGRATIFDRLPEALPRLMTIGRLDMNTEGLLMLTNDGGLSRYLELPSTGWTRRYRVRVHGRVTDAKLAKLKAGITHEGIRYKPILAELQSQNGTNSWLEVSLTEGKNREVRRTMEAVDLTVNRLIRTSYGPFMLGNLPKGAVQEVKPSVLKSQIAGYFKHADHGKTPHKNTDKNTDKNTGKRS